MNDDQITLAAHHAILGSQLNVHMQRAYAATHRRQSRRDQRQHIRRTVRQLLKAAVRGVGL